MQYMKKHNHTCIIYLNLLLALTRMFNCLTVHVYAHIYVCIIRLECIGKGKSHRTHNAVHLSRKQAGPQHSYYGSAERLIHSDSLCNCLSHLNTNSQPPWFVIFIYSFFLQLHLLLVLLSVSGFNFCRKKQHRQLIIVIKNVILQRQK